MDDDQVLREIAHLRELLEVKVRELEKRLDDRYEIQIDHVRSLFASAERADIKAEQSADKRFEAVNEFRQQLADQAVTFLPRAVYDTAHKAVNDKILVNSERLNSMDLRLSSRLDVLAGITAGGTSERAEGRAGRADMSQVLVPVLMVLSVLISVGAIIAVVLKK